MATGTEPLQIVVNNLDVTKLVPKGSLTMSLELSNRVSTATFTVDKANALGIAVNQTVLIAGAVNYSPVYFIGYVTARRYVKRGVHLSAQLECASIAMRLQKSVVNGTFTGTNAEILDALLQATTPDLTNMFDFAPLFGSEIDTFGLDDYTFDVNNLSLLDALGEFADLTGADWNVEQSQDVWVNYFPNPALQSTMKYCSGDITIGGSYGPAGWNSANVVWDAAGGESGGGIVITSQDVGGVHYATCVLGYDGTNISNWCREVPVQAGDQYYIYFSFRVKISDIDGAHSGTVWATEKDINGVTTGGGGLGALDGTLTTSWSTMGHGRLLSNAGSDMFAFIMTPLFQRSSTAFTLNIDKIMVEVFTSVAFPTAPYGSYFDGNDSGVEWMGTPNDSASMVYNAGNTLNWREDADAADFDIDLANMTEVISDFEFDSTGFDFVNSLIVIGGTSYEDVLWEYPGDGQLTHFDLEVEMFPRTGTLIGVDKNTGSDGTPTWTAQTVAKRAGDVTLGVGNDLLWATDSHWLEFNTAPALLKRAFRVTAKIAYQVRATVTDQDSVDASGITLTSVIVNENVTSEAEAHAFATNELERRARPSCTFTTMEPGLLPNRVMNVVDSMSGINENMIIERVRKTYLGGGYIRSEVEAGEPAKDMVDLVADIAEEAQRRPPITVTEAAATLQTITKDGTPVVRNGVPIYKRIG